MIREKRPGMKHHLVTFAVIGLMLVGTVSVVILFKWSIKCETYDARSFMMKQIDHRAVSIACYEMMTQPQYRVLDNQHDLTTDNPKLPTAIRQVNHSILKVSTNDITIWRGAGVRFTALHFSRSATGSNTCQLIFTCYDGPSDLVLYTLMAPANLPAVE